MAKTRNVPAQRITTVLHEQLRQKWGTLEEAEEAFKRADVVTEYALLLNALAAFQIAEQKLYRPKFKTLEAYLLESKTRLGISRAYFFERMRIGAAYMQYRGQLHAAGFQEERDSSNLRLFNRAVTTYGTEKAIANLPKMTFREYQAWIWKKARKGVDLTKVKITDDGILYDGELVVSARDIARIYADGEEPYIISVRSDSEKRALSRYLGKLREKGKD